MLRFVAIVFPLAVLSTTSQAMGHEDLKTSEARLAARNHERDQIIAAAKLNPEYTTNAERTESLEWLIDESELVSTNGRILTNLLEIEQRQLRESRLTAESWSGPAWQMYRGHTAQRYAVAPSRKAKTWLEAWNVVSSPGNTFLDVVLGQSPLSLDKLSPAEKYDLLFSTPIQNPNGFLTDYEWNQGRKRWQKTGEVSKWIGYCHGWAAASTIIPRPLHGVRVPSANNLGMITFSPADIKALVTALWANALPRLRLIGTRCQDAKPVLDENGRPVEERCFSPNPATVHLALVNQIGVARRHLLVDSTYSREVWNKPIIGYSYTYFNPQTNKESSSLEASEITITKFTKDRFKKYRSPRATSVVGIKMKITYRHGTVTPQTSWTDQAKNDITRTVNYRYDIELDEKNEAIGGEWYQLEHPDFLWVLQKSTRAVSSMDDKIVEPWRAGQPVPESWSEFAAKAAAKGQPLAAIIERLVELARQ